MRVVLSGGGTGGHINPALSIADEIKRRVPDAEISFIGTQKGMESRLIPKAGYEIDYVKVQGFKRSLSPKNFIAAYRAVASFTLSQSSILPSDMVLYNFVTS